MEFIIVGAGKFGSALSRIYLKQGIRVFCIKKIDPWPEKKYIGKNHAVILCVPAQEIPTLIEQRHASLSCSPYIVSTAKGLIRDRNQTALEYLQTQFYPKVSLFVLSGPSFASELNNGKPTALVLAGKNRSGVEVLSKYLSTPQLRIYKSFDPRGVELCGALKNVYAIAAGISEGLELGDNARAALTTRALAEMTRVGTALGSKTLTFFGLAGAGDLFLTCSSRQSRNFQFGIGLAQGKSTTELLKQLGTVEGVWTAQVAALLCRKHKLRAPLVEMVSQLLENKLTVSDAFTQLMSRKVRHEFE